MIGDDGEESAEVPADVYGHDERAVESPWWRAARTEENTNMGGVLCSVGDTAAPRVMLREAPVRRS